MHGISREWKANDGLIHKLTLIRLQLEPNLLVVDGQPVEDGRQWSLNIYIHIILWTINSFIMFIHLIATIKSRLFPLKWEWQNDPHQKFYHLIDDLWMNQVCQEDEFHALMIRFFFGFEWKAIALLLIGLVIISDFAAHPLWFVGLCDKVTATNNIVQSLQENYVVFVLGMFQNEYKKQWQKMWDEKASFDFIYSIALSYMVETK